jgi:hypothetical protein
MELIKRIYLLLCGFIFCLNSCQDKKSDLKTHTNDTQENNYNDGYTGKYCYKRLFINYNYPDSITEEIETYISKNNDTVVNQIKYYKKGILDSTNSCFYNINLIQSNKPDTYKGTFHYYSNLDSDPKNIDSKKLFKLAINQKTKDSIYTQLFEINGLGNKIEFELINYKSNQLVATMSEFRVLKIDNSDRVRIAVTELGVDNKLETCNVGLQLLKSQEGDFKLKLKKAGFK